MHWSSRECCWLFPIVVFAGHSVAKDVDYQSAAGLGCAEDTDHDSTDRVVPRTSAESLAVGWYVDEYCF